MGLATDRIDALFSKHANDDSPGCAVALIDDGQIVYHRCYGMADLEKGIPITPHPVFYIASVSKQFTAACIVLLAQRGVISLDDDIRRYFPELPDYGHIMTIRHLIYHTSGLRDNLDLWYVAGHSFVKPFDNVQVLELLYKQKGTNFAPGEKHLYCNSGYKLMAELVPCVDDNNEEVHRRVHYARIRAKSSAQPTDCDSGHSLGHHLFAPVHARPAPGRAQTRRPY